MKQWRVFSVSNPLLSDAKLLFREMNTRWSLGFFEKNVFLEANLFKKPLSGYSAVSAPSVV